MNYLYVFLSLFSFSKNYMHNEVWTAENLAKTFLKCNKIGHILFSLYGITLKRLNGLRNAPIRAAGKKNTTS